MAGTTGASSSAASLSAAAEARFGLQERKNRWSGCFGGLSCFGSQKGGKRIVPATRTPDGNTAAIRAQSAALSNQNTAVNLSLLAPPSSPASFTNSALPSTAQSPNYYLSVAANSPGGPSSAMYATGPYAHETQLVSPPAFSTYTTEPSTAPLTPPPELAHLTTPSSPDVPFARFLSSSNSTSSYGNGMAFMPSSYVGGNDLQATYAYYPGSPSSSLISPASGTPRTGMTSPFPEREVTTQWGTPLSGPDSPYPRHESSNLFGLGSTSTNFMLPADSSFFSPATSAQFYLDQAQQSLPSYAHCGGKLNTSREAEGYSGGGNRHSKPCKQDVEEIEAYRASFGFSADEIITAESYVETSEPADDSFTMSPFSSNKLYAMESPKTGMINGANIKTFDANNGLADRGRYTRKFFDDTFTKTSDPRSSKSILSGQSCSDVEIDYRRARSLRDTRGILAWRESLP